MTVVVPPPVRLTPQAKIAGFDEESVRISERLNEAFEEAVRTDEILSEMKGFTLVELRDLALEPRDGGGSSSSNKTGEAEEEQEEEEEEDTRNKRKRYSLSASSPSSPPPSRSRGGRSRLNWRGKVEGGDEDENDGELEDGEEEKKELGRKSVMKFGLYPPSVAFASTMADRVWERAFLPNVSRIRFRSTRLREGEDDDDVDVGFLVDCATMIYRRRALTATLRRRMCTAAARSGHPAENHRRGSRKPEIATAAALRGAADLCTRMYAEGYQQSDLFV